MSLFVCSKCGCIDNTAMGGYWVRGDKSALCVECDPSFGRWHNMFPKRKYNADKDNVLNPEEYLKGERMKKYRKKPVVIEAVKWTGKNLKEIIDFAGLRHSAKKWTWEEYEDVVKREGLKIFTIEGALKASIGDFIIKDIKGEFYPCKPDIFQETYEEE